MKKVACALIAILVLSMFCGCMAHKDPMGEYEVLAQKGDVDGITRLADDLMNAKDYENAGAVFSALGQDNQLYKFKYRYDAMRESFAGHEAIVGIEAWSYLYARAITSHHNAGKGVVDQFKLMLTYHDLLYGHFSDAQSALAHVGDQQYLDMPAPEGEFLSQCGNEGNGKALVYAPFREAQKNGRIMLGLTAALPDALLPASLDEVEYAVVLRYTTKKVGTYTNNGAAERVLLEIDVVHCPDGKVLKTYPAIEGGDPPKSITTAKGDNHGATGDDPSGAAIAPVLAEAFSYIDSLP